MLAQQRRPHEGGEGTMPDLAPEIIDLIARIEAMLQRVLVVGPMGGGTFDDLRAAALEAIAEMFAAAGGAETPVHHESEHTIDVGGSEIRARVYTPAGAGPFPALLHFHGGAWIMGSYAWPTFATCARDVAERTPCVVVDVDYRLAPEHQFPVAPEDCYASLLWLTEHASELGIDPARIAVGGDSAGGALAAAVCLMARDRGGPAIAAQVLEVPATDHAHVETYPSAIEFATGYGLDTESLVAGRVVYFARPEDALNPYASPMLADDLSDLPPAYILTAELDPLRDSGEAYGRRLAEAGVSTVVSRQAGHIHGSSFLLYPAWEGARRWREELVGAVRSALAPAPEPVG
jgi:acetyl esterase